MRTIRSTAPGKRFADVYTSGGGTLANSQAMATRAQQLAWVPAAQLLDDRTTATLTDADYAHELIFKLSGLTHDGVPAYYFGKLVGTSPERWEMPVPFSSSKATR